MSKSKPANRAWVQVEGEQPGTEYHRDGELVSVRIWNADLTTRECGPAAIIGGSVNSTVRFLLYEMRNSN